MMTMKKARKEHRLIAQAMSFRAWARAGGWLRAQQLGPSPKLARILAGVRP
jgi:hypothetical protein